MKLPAFFSKIKKKHYIIILIILIIIMTLQQTNAIQKIMNIYKIKPLQNKIIVVDPGHGGIDGGTSFEDILEKDINLEIGLKLKKELEQKGAMVIITREVDDSLDDHIPGNGSRHREDLNARVEIANDNKADMLISVHVNYSKNKNKLGPIVFYYEDSEVSKKLAEYIQNDLNDMSSYKRKGIKTNHDVTSGNFFVLRNSQCPGVIVETGFISNEIDRVLLLDKKHHEEIVKMIGKSIITYLNEETDMMELSDFLKN